MRKTFLAFGILIYILISAIPTVFAESDLKRVNDGFNDGSNAARTDTTFNPACDPLGIHTSDGQHTTIYCNAWAQGYTSTWDSIHSASGSPGSTSPPSSQSACADGSQPDSNGNCASQQSPNEPNYSGICQTLQPVLIQSCDNLVNTDGSLTPNGFQALGCIRNGILLGGGASLLGFPLPVVLKGLSILASPTGCGGIVDMKGFDSLGNIGSLGSILNSLP